MSSNIPNFITKNYPLRVSDFDRNNKILPSSVLDIFQDVAGIHAEMLGISGPQILERSLCWMITRGRYEVVKQPKLYQTVVVKTWPVESRRIELDRDYEIRSEDGELLIKGTSQWVVMDITDRSAPKLVPARDFDIGLDEYVTDRAFEGAFTRVVYKSVECDEPYLCRSGYTDLDMNGHVNNVKYSSFALNAIARELSASTEISGVRIDYVKEVLEGDVLKIHHTVKENEDGTLEFLCRGATDAAPVNFGVKFTVRKV